MTLLDKGEWANPAQKERKGVTQTMRNSHALVTIRGPDVALSAQRGKRKRRKGRAIRQKGTEFSSPASGVGKIISSVLRVVKRKASGTLLHDHRGGGGNKRTGSI